MRKHLGIHSIINAWKLSNNHLKFYQHWQWNKRRKSLSIIIPHNLFNPTTLMNNVFFLFLFFFKKEPYYYPGGIYMFKVNNKNIRTRCEICSKITVKIPERRQWHCFGVFIVHFEHISHILLLTFTR